MTTVTDTQCAVYTTRPPHYLHRVQCGNKATTERAGVQCCGVHARQADRWDAQGQMETMVKFWWGK